MPKKIFITRKIPAIAEEMLRAKGFEVDVFEKESVPKQKHLIKIIKKGQYDGVITMINDEVDGVMLDALPSVKIFANFGVGFNNFKPEEAQKRGVVMTNTGGTSSIAVAECAVALILALATRIVEGDEYVRAGKYKGWRPMDFFGLDLAGKTLGLVGVGNIGSKVAHMAHGGFDMNIIYYDLNRNEQIEKDSGAVKAASLDDLLKSSDFVSLHVPLLDSTRHLINEQRLKLMKSEAFLINTSRGPVVDEKALVQALRDKVIRGAGLDVFENEPDLAPGLIKLPNVILTPHIASARESARIEMAKTAAQNIIDFFDGKTPTNKVN